MTARRLDSPAQNPICGTGNQSSIGRQANNGQDHRHRPRHDEQLRGDHGGRTAQGDRELGRRTHDAFGRRVSGGRRNPGRRVGEAAGRHQRQEHGVRGQAADRPALRGKGSAEGHQPDALQDRQARQRRRLGRDPRQEDRAVAGVGGNPAQDEEDGGGLPRRGSDRGGHHRAGVLQRLAAPGDQGRRQDRRPRGQAHHQRADGRGARVRHGQEGRRSQDRRLRPGRRHVRHLDHRDRGDRRRAPVRGAVDQRRHVPGRRGLRPARDRLHRHRVQEGAGRRPEQRRARAAAAEGSRREGEDRAVVVAADRHQPAVHHGRPVGSQAPVAADHARQVRVAGRGPDRAHHRAVPHRDQGRRRQPRKSAT